MNPKATLKFGLSLYHQSLTPYNRQPLGENVEIVGLDTEYFVRNDANCLLCWQLGFEDNQGVVLEPPINAWRMANEVQKHTKRPFEGRAKTIFFITYFITAEAQFFYSGDWKVSEFKGKYSFSTKVDGVELIVLDLMAWFGSEARRNVPLSEAAKVFDLQKLDYPIVERMQSVSSGKTTKEAVLHDEAFRAYAINDAVVVGQIWRCIRNLMLSRFDVDILLTRTSPATSAAIFRKFYIKESLIQPWTLLRKQAIASAWGGRTECFYRGVHDKAFAFDATSHHPSSVIAMRILPTADDWYKVTEIEKWLKATGGVGRVVFEYPDGELYPCLPVFSNNSLIFPLRGVSDCTLFEAQYAVECGAKLTLIKGFAYNTGTTILADFMTNLKNERAKATHKAEREMLKLLMNGLVGKFFQKNLAPSLQVLKDYAEKHNLPLLTVMSAKGLDLPNSATVGSSFFPEWYSLILGYARANISRIARENEALMVSSDSVVTLNSDLKITDKSIEYKAQDGGSYLAYRSKLYRLGAKEAHHAIHSSLVASEVLGSFLENSSVNYQVSHIVMLREACKGVGTFGSQKLKDMTVHLGYDHKRRLLDNGTTVPWKDKEEREEALAGHVKFD